MRWAAARAAAAVNEAVAAGAARTDISLAPGPASFTLVGDSGRALPACSCHAPASAGPGWA